MLYVVGCRTLSTIDANQIGYIFATRGVFHFSDVSLLWNLHFYGMKRAERIDYRFGGVFCIKLHRERLLLSCIRLLEKCSNQDQILMLVVICWSLWWCLLTVFIYNFLVSRNISF